MHATWNSIGKRSATSAAFFIWATALGTLLFSPLLLPHWRDILELPASFWWLLFISGGFQALYLAGLAKAYTKADLSLVYPLARSTPVMLVPVLVWLIYSRSALSGLDLIAMLFIVVGALILPLTRWSAWKLSNYFNAGVGWALVAAFGTAGYSVIDSAAILNMRALGWEPFAAGSTFVVLQGVSIVAWMLPILKWGFRESVALPKQLKPTLLAGTFIMLTYLLVLVSMSMVEEVSYVVALRQLSIPIGVAIGALWLREKLSLPRIQGVSLMLIGLVLVSSS